MSKEKSKKPSKVKSKEDDVPEVAVVPEEVTKVKEDSKPERNSRRQNTETMLDGWVPKTLLGKKVKNGEISDLGTILDQNIPLLEYQIVDALIENLETGLLLIGQSKGKFGGGKRRVFRQTQKKTREGNKPHFATVAVVGNKNGFVGMGYGKAKETVPAREKAFREAKLNIIKIRRGSGSWEDATPGSHSIPYKVSGKCGSVKITLIPAPKGTGLCIESECAKILSLAGIEDVWSKTSGQTKIKINLIKACMSALKKLTSTKVQDRFRDSLGIVDGAIAVRPKEEVADE